MLGGADLDEGQADGLGPQVAKECVNGVDVRDIDFRVFPNYRMSLWSNRELTSLSMMFYRKSSVINTLIICLNRI